MYLDLVREISIDYYRALLMVHKLNEELKEGM